MFPCDRAAGTLPPAWGAQGFLFHLKLAGNQLTGPLPQEWGRMLHLLTLDASKNRQGGSACIWSTLLCAILESAAS